MKETLVGKGREAIGMLAEEGSFQENIIGSQKLPGELGPGAVAGTISFGGKPATILANDAQAINPRFPVVYFGVIGLEEAYKMALAVYMTMEEDQHKPLTEKRPLLLLVDTPGNGPGKVEEMVGMNKATGAYQLALAQARRQGHPVVAVVIGRAISGAFLCHGLQADHILSLSQDWGTMIHVMPISSISRITKIDVERLEELAQDNPVFAAGAQYFYRLGGVQEILDSPEQIQEAVSRHVAEIRQKKQNGQWEELGPMGRGLLGAARKGRNARPEVLRRMREEYRKLEAEGLFA